MAPSNKPLVFTRARPPYQAGKVQVGLLYTPPLRRHFSADEDRLQAALLDSSTPGLSSPVLTRRSLSWLAGGALVVFSVLAAVLIFLGGA